MLKIVENTLNPPEIDEKCECFVTRTSTLSNKERTVILPISQERLNYFMTHEFGSVDMKLALPSLNFDELEFLKAGIVQEEWEKETQSL